MTDLQLFGRAWEAFIVFLVVLFVLAGVVIAVTGGA